ncbi:hypothetical protein RKJ96_09725 [Klebsiella pneumoniae]|nr:hypothetical protein [Klebsiella pneumoniae]
MQRLLLRPTAELSIEAKQRRKKLRFSIKRIKRWPKRGAG